VTLLLTLPIDELRSSIDDSLTSESHKWRLDRHKHVVGRVPMARLPWDLSRQQCSWKLHAALLSIATHDPESLLWESNPELNTQLTKGAS